MIALLSLLGLGLALGLVVDSSDSDSDDSFDEEITLTDEDDTYVGTAGDDLIQAAAGDDDVRGGGGNDTLFGEAGSDLLQGGLGDDLLEGGSLDDGLFGDAGADTLNASSGNNILSGGDGSDVLAGGDDADLLIGGNGSDLIDGGAGDDGLIGSVAFSRDLDVTDYAQYRAGTLPNDEGEVFFADWGISGQSDGAGDTLLGADGDDFILLGSSDTATGGTGENTFVVGDWIEAGAPAQITDFESGFDTILLAISEETSGDDYTVSEEVNANGQGEIYVNGTLIAIIDGTFDALDGIGSDVQQTDYERVASNVAGRVLFS